MNDGIRSRAHTPTGSTAGLLGAICLGITACGFVSRGVRSLDSPLRSAPPRQVLTFREASFPALTAELPIPAGAEYVDNDTRCLRCHKEYKETFPRNVHSGLRDRHACEACHGPCSEHVKGEKVGTALSFAAMDPAQRSEACGRCHESDASGLVSDWRTSVHSHSGVSCTDCHRAHYDVPRENEPATSPAEAGKENSLSREARSETPTGQHHRHGTSNNLDAVAPKLCYRCHQDMVGEKHVAGPHQIGGPNGFNCTTCHNPHAKITQQNRLDQCLVCHRNNSPIMAWHSSTHAAAGVACADCHETHPRGGNRPSMSVSEPETCYKCHTDKVDLHRIAGPHQIGGPNGFSCTTCHDPHGKLREESRRDLCLTCHQNNTPTMAWHSSTHAIAGVACTDCHNPHPRPSGEQPTNISHTSVTRPQRKPMSVSQPEACYKCHPKLRGMSALPSHHPIEEGKMVCSDCHDAHGQAEGGLREPTLNQVCYRCHAEKEGPMVYEHPPVTEDCGICHAPHGTVTNDLLRQPPTFLCLRCHAGHRSATRQIDDPDNSVMRRALYTDCMQCHTEVHGSDHINETLRGRGLTR